MSDEQTHRYSTRRGQSAVESPTTLSDDGDEVCTACGSDWIDFIGDEIGCVPCSTTRASKQLVQDGADDE